MTTNQHQSVLLEEAIEQLAIKPDGTYIDGTFGRGGHSRAILAKLSERGHLLAFDKDLAAVAAAQQSELSRDSRFSIYHGSFTALHEQAAERKWLGKVDGILLDLGVSSPQLDIAERGFSFLREGPLDMRMNTAHGIDAATWLQRTSERELAAVLKDFGEERYAVRIARAIMAHNKQQAITTTTQLAEIVAKAHPRWEPHKHPATRTFQALRIVVNNELSDLTEALQQALSVLRPGGRLLVISFHSLEDRIVKAFIRQHTGADLPAKLPIRAADTNICLRRINGAIRPSENEIKNNPRARSATLRVMEKIA